MSTMSMAKTLLAVLTAVVLLLVSGAQAAPPPRAGKPPKPQPTASAPDEEPPPAPPPAPDPPAQAPAEDSGDVPLPPPHDPVTMSIGVQLESITKFDLATQTFNVELVVNVICDKEPCNPDLNVRNGTMQGKPEKLHEGRTEDGHHEKRFKIKAEVDGYIDLTEYPHDDHALLVLIDDKGDPEQVKYAVDYDHTGLGERLRIPGWNLDLDAKPQQMIITRTDEVGETYDPVTKTEKEQKVSYVVFGLEVHRPRMAATFKSLVPVCFMVFVAGFALLLKPKSAAGRLTTATGGLMTLVMFHVGQINALPPLGYLTRLDKFMIATYLVYLVHIGFSVTMVRTEEAKKEKASELLYLVSAGAVPGLALVAWLAVWLRLV
jgi:hypothetical protein